jgi:hypothetical protein
MVKIAREPLIFWRGGRSHERGKGWRRLLSGIDCKGDTEKLRWGLRGGELLQSQDMTWGFNVSWRERIERKLTWREGKGKNLSNVWGYLWMKGWLEVRRTILEKAPIRLWGEIIERVFVLLIWFGQGKKRQSEKRIIYLFKTEEAQQPNRKLLNRKFEVGSQSLL